MRVQSISLLLLQLISLNLSVDLNTYYKTYIQGFGYKLEENSVTTDDGYILSVWHLSPKGSNGKIVFMQHGLADTAWTFFQLGKNSLPFLLLKEGFDIWLGNTRGSIFSNSHISKNPKDPKSGYNDYSIDNLAANDLPAMIKFVRSKTGNKKITYLAHSQGTTIFFMLSMHDPTFVEESFDRFVALGTVPNIAYTKFAPIEILDKIGAILKNVGIIDNLNLSHNLRESLANFCKISPNICGSGFELATCLKPSGKLNYKSLYNFLYYYPGGVSKRNLLHWSQIHQMKKLVYYNPNFEKEKKAKEYNTDYLKKWKIKSLIARTDDDTLSSYQDVTDFYSAAENKKIIKILDLVNYGNVDCIAAESAINEIFIPVIKFLKF